MILPNNYYKFKWPKVCLWDRIIFLVYIVRYLQSLQVPVIEENVWMDALQGVIRQNAEKKESQIIIVYNYCNI